MSTSKTDALYLGGALALVALAFVAVFRARRQRTATNSIPARWAGLEQLHPDVQLRFLNLFLRIEARTGGTVVLTSGYRPEVTASTLPAYHFFGLATDINVILKNGAWLKMGTPVATWEASGVPAIIRGAGFRWGGDFHATASGALSGDPVHVDLGRDYPIAMLRTKAFDRAMPKGSLQGFDARIIPLDA